MSDPQKYRTKEEVEEYKSKDPIEIVKNKITEEKWADDAWFEEIAAKIKAQVEEAVKFAEESPFPEPEELYKDVYAQKDYPFIKD